MEIRVKNGVAVICGTGLAITDGQSALDIIADVYYNHNTSNIAIPKEAIDPSFFKLSTGLAGDVLQKFTNYSARLAIFGDFSEFESKSLKDFMYECNKGISTRFVSTEEEAIEALVKMSNLSSN